MEQELVLTSIGFRLLDKILKLTLMINTTTLNDQHPRLQIIAKLSTTFF